MGRGDWELEGGWLLPGNSWTGRHIFGLILFTSQHNTTEVHSMRERENRKICGERQVVPYSVGLEVCKLEENLVSVIF